MAKAIFNKSLLATSDAFELVENNVYFPPDSVQREFLRPSDTRTHCPWKGECSYYDVVIGDTVNRDAAWYYPDPKPAAANIKDHVAFWKGVQVER